MYYVNSGNDVWGKPFFHPCFTLEQQALAERMVNVGEVEEWNEIREEATKEFSLEVINWLDYSGLIYKVLMANNPDHFVEQRQRLSELSLKRRQS